MRDLVNYLNYKEKLKLVEYYINNNKLNDDIISEAFNFNVYFDNDNVESLKYDIFQTYLYERLKDSIKIDEKFVYELCKQFKGIKSIKVYNDYKLNIIYTEPFSIKNKLFVSFCNFFNYYIINDKQYDSNNNILNLEARKPKDVTSMSLPYVYHITNKANLKNIMKRGLIPKFASKISNKTNDYENPTHIYVFQCGINKQDLLTYSRLLGISNNELAIIKIDTNKFNTDHNCKLKFYGDPSSIGFPAMFTEEPISPKYLTENNIENIEF